MKKHKQNDDEELFTLRLQATECIHTKLLNLPEKRKTQPTNNKERSFTETTNSSSSIIIENKSFFTLSTSYAEQNTSKVNKATQRRCSETI